MRWFNIIVISKLYLISLGVFSLFRILLFCTELDRIDASTAFADILGAFFMGLRFDVVIAGYLLALPFLILSILFIGNWKPRIIVKSLFYYCLISFGVAFLVCAADIPYFNQFFSRFSITAFEWMGTDPEFVFHMIVEEPRYWLSIIPFGILLFLFAKALQKIWKGLEKSEPIHGKFFLKLVVSILFLGLMFIGVRGRIDEKSPIRIGTAYVFNNAFLNQLGLNPNFTFIRSYLNSKKEENKEIHLIPNEEAIANVQRYLGIDNPFPGYPIARTIQQDSTEGQKQNVVLVIMESMSASKMGRHGNQKNLTPFLDQLTTSGFYFENTYTAGIHTFNGVFSTLFSFPALFRQHPMQQVSMLKYNGLASTLKQHGYTNIYFTTHDGQFDNAEGFLKANDFDKVISKANYPSEKIKTTLGVPDDYMFEFSIPIINDLAKKSSPFLATFMTASDHGPYYIPEYFNPKNEATKDQVVEYADWSIEKFMALARQEPWFDKTLFVFVADHGSPMDVTYAIPLSYYHTPLLFYSRKITKSPNSFPCIGGQIDVFPTIMGLLNLSYVNNTLGIDLINETRPYIYFNGDDKYGVLDQEWLLIVQKDNSMKLHQYRTKDTRDYSSMYPEIAKTMKTYAASNLQAFQYVTTNKMQCYK